MQVTTYYKDVSLNGFFNEFLGGVYLVPGWMSMLRYGLLFFICLHLSISVYLAFKKNNNLFLWCYWSACFISFISGLILIDPWDELFINLKHPFNLLFHQNYSFSRWESVEGTVEFLPMILVAGFGKCGLSLIHGLYLLNLFSVWGCLYFIFKILKSQISNSGFVSLAILCFALSGPLVFGVAGGFSTPVFVMLILGAFYFLFLKESSSFGNLFLSLIPLARIEGVLIVGLIFLYKNQTSFRYKRALKSTLLVMFLIFFPTLLLTSFRWYKFGYAIPLPVHFKSTGLQWAYLNMGRIKFTKDIASSYFLVVAVCMAFIWYVKRNCLASLSVTLPRYYWGVFLIFLLCSLPYYFSGGDWLPSYWLRYLAPLVLFTWIVFICFVWRSLLQLKQSQMKWATGLALALLVWSYYPLNGNYSTVFNRLIRPVSISKNRIQDLSLVGDHFNKVTDSTTRIASSELATLMYFADRDAVDFLGVTTPLVAMAPLGGGANLIHKRIRPDLIRIARPEIVWPDFYITDLNILENGNELEEEILKLKKEKLISNLEYFGGWGVLKKYHYKLFACGYKNRTIIYFVSPHYEKRHLQLLEENHYVPLQEKHLYRNLSKWNSADQIDLQVNN